MLPQHHDRRAHATPRPLAPAARAALLGPAALLARALALVLALVLAPAAHAQPQRPRALPCTPPEAVAAFRAVERAARARDPGPLTTALYLPDVAAAAVQLRVDGAIVGRGQDGTPGATGIAAALRAALREAESRLPNDPGLLRDDALADLARRCTVSLELAGPLLPLDPQPGEELDALLAPGLDGIAVSRAGVDAPPERMFPATMLAAGSTPGLAAGGLVARLLDNPEAGLLPPRTAIERHSVRYARFRSLHLAQARPGDPPRFKHRGSEPIDRAELSAAGLDAFADRLSAHLAARLVRADDPPRPRERALAAVALARIAARHRHRAPDLLARDTAAAVSALEQLTLPDDPADRLVTAALALRAARELSRPLAAHRDALAAELAPVWTTGTGFKTDVPPPARACVAWALAGLPPAETGAPAAGAPLPPAADLISAILKDTPADQLIALTPWIGWAMLDNAPRGELAAAPALRELRTAVWRHQVPYQAPGADDIDLAGGIALTRGPAGTAAARRLPTWQSARPVALVASMLGDPRVTLTASSLRPRTPAEVAPAPDEVLAELARLLDALRFLRQLEADERTAWMSADPAADLGAIRAAPWDPAMPLDATSLTLIAVAETLKGLQSARP